MCAPKRPCSTCRPRRHSASPKPSTSALASSGGAALVKPGRRPRLRSAYRVNWLTSSTCPPTSRPLIDAHDHHVLGGQFYEHRLDPAVAEGLEVRRDCQPRDKVERRL